MAAFMQRAQLVRGLGWFSIGLGLVQVARPRHFARLIGTERHAAVVRAVGMRELLSGIGLLADRRRAPGWLNARLGGDAMDLSLLALALRTQSARRSRVLAATTAVAGVTALDMYARRKFGPTGAQTIRLSMVVNRPPEELYRFWRQLDNLPRVMANLDAVEQTAERRWHWVAKGPLGFAIEWDADITADQPNELLAWRSVEGEPIQNAGAVRFERLPGDRGTVVKVDMHYHAPGAAMASLLGRLLGNAPEQQLREALRSFKQIMETGEVVTTVGQSAGHRPPSLLLKLEAARQPRSGARP